MIDVFVRIAPMNLTRFGMALACKTAWGDIPEANVRTIVAEGSFLPWSVMRSTAEVVLPLGKGKMATFHWESRAYADEHAQTEPYILADDDRLPLGKDWVQKAVRYWEKYNQDHKYVMMCDRSALWTEDPGQGKLFENMDLPMTEIANWWSGANYLSYKGAIPYKEFWGPADQQDPDLQRWAVEHGKRQCFMMHCVVNHLGAGWSQVQPSQWGKW